MSVIRVTKDDVESFTLVTTPSRFYSSGSSSGVTGSIKVYPRLSSLEKTKERVQVFDETSPPSVIDAGFDSTHKVINDLSRTNRSLGNSISSEASSYLELVSSSSVKQNEVLEVGRFTPTSNFTKYSVMKRNVKDVLMRHYKVEYGTADWSYTNYNSLNFFTDYDGLTPVFPTESVLAYPNASDDSLPEHEGYVSGSYCLSGAFSFEFYINPRYRDNGKTGVFNAGTIFHMSSSYAVSLVSGSLKNHNGELEGFRLQLQLSHSADYSPSTVPQGAYPYDLVFLSDDNSLRYNKWHHVVVRWGTNLVNNGTGSFVVDGMNRGNFLIPSGTIMPKAFTSSGNPDALFVGNFYEGTNSGNSLQSLFFSEKPSKRFGVLQLSSDSVKDDPETYLFRHPLNAEVHDLSIRRSFYSDSQIATNASKGLGSECLSKNIAFFVPPFFVEETPIRRVVDGKGGVPQTPFFSIDGSSDDPFNVAMSFGVNGHYINLENFTKDFSTGRFPRLISLSGSVLSHNDSELDANQLLYQDGQIAKRNLSILPCDDGMFDPNYEILSSERYTGKYSDTRRTKDYSLINLNELVSTASISNNGASQEISDDFMEDLYGPTPEYPGIIPGPSYKSYISGLSSSISSLGSDADFLRSDQLGAPLAIYQRTLDPSSNQVTIFNISNIYYGRRILPGSFVMSDSSLSGSNGRVSITLKDDYLGNIYRADSETEHSTQNSVGNIFYDEGIVVVKSPHLFFFGKNGYEISFRGVQNIYSQKYEILAGPGLLNSSSNPTYLRNYENLKPSGDPKDNEPFVYISGMNFHDENMNVVAKARLAQPIIKREGDKILFKVAFDY